MGINLHAFKFLHKISKTRKFGNTLTLGRLKVYFDKIAVDEILNKNKILNNDISDDTYIDNYLIHLFGSDKVDVLDANNYENANIIHNLNYDVPEELKDKYDLIIDGGSLEHVFDIKTALTNLKKMCKVNGTIIHISPANNFCGHGFYQFSPNLFGSFYRESQGFRDTNIILCKMFDSSVWCKIKRENFNNNKRINIISDEETMVLVSSTKIENINNPKTIQQSDYSENFYKQKKLKTNQESIKEKSLFKKKIKKVFYKFHLIRKIYNLIRKYFEYKNNKLDKKNKDLDIIKV